MRKKAQISFGESTNGVRQPTTGSFVSLPHGRLSSLVIRRFMWSPPRGTAVIYGIDNEDGDGLLPKAKTAGPGASDVTQARMRKAQIAPYALTWVAALQDALADNWKTGSGHEFHSWLG